MIKANCTINKLSVAAVAGPRLDIIFVLEGNKALHVYDAAIIRHLSQLFRAPYKILTPSDGGWGKMLPDGNWSGMVGMVKRSEVDLAVGGIPLDSELFQAVRTSYPYLFSDNTFVTDKPKSLPSNLSFFHPFSLTLWISIIAIIFIISFIFFILTVRKKESFQTVLFLIFGSSVQQPVSFKLRKTNLKLLLGSWLFFNFVITNSYKALFLSSLSFPPLTGIRNIQDLAIDAERGEVTCFTYKENMFSEIFLKSDIESWRSIGRCLKRNVITYGSPEELFLKAPRNKVFIDAKIYLTQYEKDFFFSEDSFFNTMFIFPISRHFLCEKDLNKYIHRLLEAGLFLKHVKDEQFQFGLEIGSFNKSESHTSKKLRIANLKEAFLILISGYILATITLFVEIAVNFCNEKIEYFGLFCFLTRCSFFRFQEIFSVKRI